MTRNLKKIKFGDNLIRKFSNGNYLIFVDSIIFTLSIILAVKVYTDIRGLNFFGLKYFYIIWIILNIFVFKFIGVYKERVRFAGSRINYLILIANIFALLPLFVVSFLFKYEITFEFLFLLFLNQSILLLFTRSISRTIYINLNKSSKLKDKKRDKVIIYGAGNSGASLAYQIICQQIFDIRFFVDDNKSLWGREIFGFKIYSPDKIKKESHSVDKILVAIPKISKKQKEYITKELIDLDLEIVIIPSLDELTHSIYSKKSKDIDTKDLLMREAVNPDLNLIKKGVEGKNICVTGAGGSIGSELCKKILQHNPNYLVMIDHSEPKIYELSNKIKNNNKKTKFILGSTNDTQLIKSTFKEFGIDTVFHAAAYKHVPIVEMNPLRGIENNAISTQIICQSCIECNVKQMILISTDKAVRPTSIMGATKRLAELVVQAYSEKYPQINYSLVRFGNVLGSSGSVVPLFEKQIKNGGPITLTDNDIIRYFMTISEAAELVIQSSALAIGGEVFLLDMGVPIKIRDLAERMIQLHGLSVKDISNPDGDIEISVTGLRPGEKLYEELLIDSRSQSTEHKLIFKANEKSIPFIELIEIINDLVEAVSKSNKSVALELLSKAVTEWNRR